jgi:hypothetical protein
MQEVSTTKGLIRIEQQIPQNAEFTVFDNDNPYGCDRTSAISACRRPLPTTNIPYLSAVMWDGRETCRKNSERETKRDQLLTIESRTLPGSVVGARPLSANNVSIAENNSLVRIGLET